MRNSANSALNQDHSIEETEEIIAVLTAISTVSKRLARNLNRLEQSKRKEGKNNGTTRKSISAHAD